MIVYHFKSIASKKGLMVNPFSTNVPLLYPPKPAEHGFKIG